MSLFFYLFLSLCHSAGLIPSQFTVLHLSACFTTLHIQYLSLDIHFFPRVTLPPSPLILKFLFFFPSFFSTSHSTSLLFGQVSPVCLSSNMTTVSFSQRNTNKAGGEVIKENIECTTTGIIFTSAAALFIKPTTPEGENVPRKTQILFIAKQGQVNLCTCPDHSALAFCIYHWCCLHEFLSENNNIYRSSLLTGNKVKEEWRKVLFLHYCLSKHLGIDLWFNLQIFHKSLFIICCV